MADTTQEVVVDIYNFSNYVKENLLFTQVWCWNWDRWRSGSLRSPGYWIRSSWVWYNGIIVKTLHAVTLLEFIYYYE